MGFSPLAVAGERLLFVAQFLAALAWYVSLAIAVIVMALLLARFVAEKSV